MNSSNYGFGQWVNEIESAIGRSLQDNPGKLALGEIGMASKMYPAGLTVEGMVALINDDGAELCIC